MKICKRKTSNKVAVVLIMLVFFFMSAFSVYGILTKNTDKSILGGQVQSQYGMVEFDEKSLYMGTVCFVGITIYLILHLNKNGASKLFYDDYSVTFCLYGNEERRLSWNELKPPSIKVKWVVTDLMPPGQILCFTFEDGAKVAISNGFQNFKDLYYKMDAEGILDRFGIRMN